MKIATRPKMIAKNKNHNLWRNGKNWWLHYTQHLPDYTSKRVRLNLRTADVETARMHRDMILHDQNILHLD
jgi:hypothetical protein